MALAIHGGEPVRTAPFPERAPYGEDDLKELKEALDSQCLFLGPKMLAFEEAFAKEYGVRHAVTCTSGTAAVHMAVAALDAEPGDEIIVSPVTDFGTVSGMLFQGLIPVFADWRPHTFNTDPESIERNITDRTRAIVVVHLFGNPNDMDAIIDIARRHGIPVIEDCCQAYYTEYKGRLVGTIGNIGCFSMQESKHLPTGEGGVVITDDETYHLRMSLFRDKGWENRRKWGPRSYSMLGMNYRMNELTAAVALSQLRKTKATVDRRHTLGSLLTQLISDVPGIFPCPGMEGGRHSYWAYGLLVEGYDPELFVRAMNAEGIPTLWGYTVHPIYLCTDALRKKKTFGTSGYPFTLPEARSMDYSEGLCPVAESELKRIAVLDILENWSEDDIRDIACAIVKVADGLGV